MSSAFVLLYLCATLYFTVKLVKVLPAFLSVSVILSISLLLLVKAFPFTEKCEPCAFCD